MNKGINHSTGKWVYFLGADDQLFSNYTLSNLLTVTNNKYDLILGRIQYSFTKKDSHFVKKKNGIFTPSWSKKIWIKNTIHHQGAIYKRILFAKNNYNIQYKTLADYAFNLNLFIENKSCKIVSDVIAKCGTSGLSKNYHWKLYQEEIKLKSLQTSILFHPFIILISVTKYFLKSICKV